MIHMRALTIPFFTVFSILTMHIQASGSLLTGYISPAPDEVLHSLTAGEAQKPVVGGIKLNYFGYSDYTQNDGYFSFPKTHTSNELRIIVCQETDYELLKNTVSQVKVKKVASPQIAVYKITKEQEAKPGTPPAKKDTPQNEDQKPEAKQDEPESNSTWYFKVESLGSSVPEGGLKQQDLIIFCNPADLYIYCGSEKTTPPNAATYYAEENNNFIIPAECMYLLRSQQMADIEKDDAMTQLVDVDSRTNVVPTKSTETDSLGNPLPDVQQSTIAGAVD